MPTSDELSLARALADAALSFIKTGDYYTIGYDRDLEKFVSYEFPMVLAPDDVPWVMAEGWELSFPSLGVPIDPKHPEFSEEKLAQRIMDDILGREYLSAMTHNFKTGNY